MTSNAEASEGKKSKRKKESQSEASGNPQLEKKEEASLFEASPAKPKSGETLDAVLNDTSKEINALLSKYAHILSEKAATDASYVEELDGIIKEASSIEHHLKSKRENIRHRLCLIGGPLQSENAPSGK